MPHYSNNNDPLLDRAIFAYDGTNYRVVKVDTNGQLVAAVATGQTIKVTQDNAANLLATVNVATDQNIQARAHGYDGTNWRKLQQLWGYTDRWLEEVSNLSAAAGTNSLDTAAVASGYIHVLQNISARDVNTNPTSIILSFHDGTTFAVLLDQNGPGINRRVTWTGEVVLKAGDKARATLLGCALNDDIYLVVSGYKMKIND